MGRIDVHHHIVPPQFLKEAPASANSYRTNPKINGWSLERSLRDLDDNGVDKAILSFPQPSQWSLAVSEQRRLARFCNDFFAQVVRDRPSRFGLFAGLPPLSDADGCLAEIDYAFGALKADALRLMSSYQDVWLGDKRFAPVMDEINRRAAVVFVHPDAAVCCRNLMPSLRQ